MEGRMDGATRNYNKVGLHDVDNAGWDLFS